MNPRVENEGVVRGIDLQFVRLAGREPLEHFPGDGLTAHRREEQQHHTDTDDVPEYRNSR